jgi:hypothetical protein
MNTTSVRANLITDREREQIERANATTATPVLFIHGLWLLPSSWDNWATLFEETDLDIRTCDLGEYRAWTEWHVPGGANAHFTAGQVDDVYLIDVDRRALVIDATYRLGSSPADVAELEQILASIDVVR